MAMASWMYIGRRSGRPIRSRHDSEDEVHLDFNKDANENAREILSNICKKQGLSDGKRFNYLNAFVKLIIKLGGPDSLDYSIEELQCCLRVALIHDTSQVRSAALRAIRYLLKEEKDVRILNRLAFPTLIARCFDMAFRNDMERVQTLRLIRRMLLLAPSELAPAIMRCLVSHATSGTEEKDRMLRPCLATLSEICILNPETFITCGGVSVILNSLQENQSPRIVESLCGALLSLLNNPVTRNKAAISLHSLAAPYCDFRLYNERNRDERDNLFYCSRLAILSVLRSWPGLLHFCHPGNSSGLASLVNILYLNQLDVRKGILDLLYELLGLPQPKWTDEFSVALRAVDPSYPRDAWRLHDGFVSAEGKDVLPHLAKFRPNIVEIHLALLLYTFLQAGLLDAIVEVIVSSDTYISVRATILLGELLYLIHKMLPPDCCDITPVLPNLLSYASNPTNPIVQNQALAAVATLARLHAMLKRRPAPASLFLDRTLQAGGWGREESRTGKRSKLLTYVAPKDDDELLKESSVLTQKDGFSWNWNIVRTILKNRSEALKKLEDSNHRIFLRKLVHYYKPSSNRFSRVELGNKKQTQMYTLAGLELIDCLLEIEEAEGMKLLQELLADIWVQIDAITSSKSAHDCLFSPQHVSNSVCQDYFLFIGRFCRYSKGLRVLDKAGIFQQLLHLVTSTNHDCYVKLVVSGMDYSQDGMSRAILSKVLTASSESARLYTTQFLLVLLRAKLSDFEKWGIELLVMQLYDKSKAVSLAAIQILEEAVEEKAYLDAVISLRPSLLHLGDKGLLLLIRFLSSPNGFTFLQDANFVTTQLERWSSNYNYRYVRLVEGEIHNSLTLHQRDEDGRYSRQSSSLKPSVKDVFIPPHLYGQLVQHEKGFQLLIKEGKLQNLFQIVHSEHWASEQEELELKAALWGCGHIGTSHLGVSCLAENGIIHAIIHLAQTCPIYAVRGTAFYTLGLIATTYQGANQLSKEGWLCVRHHRQDRWPVIEEESNELSSEMLFSEGNNPSLSSQDLCSFPEGGESTETNPGKFYIPCDDDDDDDDDEGLHIEDTVSSMKWIIGSGGDMVKQKEKSQTLPHVRPPAGTVARHVRSHSECKQANEAPSGDWTFPTRRTRKDSGKGEHETKSRSNSCTDSSGVSSCDSGVGVVSKHEQTLSPIPSSTSLNTLRSSVGYRKLSSINGKLPSEGPTSLDSTASCRLSQQDISGYATLRSLRQFRRPLYSDTVSLAAVEFLVFDDHGLSNQSLSRALKVRSLDRQSIPPGLCEFEASLPPQLPSGTSSFSLAARTYIGSRSNLAAVKHSGQGYDGSSKHQCYMGICLPRDLISLYPSEDMLKLDDYDRPYCSSRKQKTTSLEELEETEEKDDERDEVEDEDENIDSDSGSEEIESQIQTYQSYAEGSEYRHIAITCLACCRLRDRKISTSSYHRYRTDTESSYGGGESPILLPKRRKSYSTSSCLLGLTPGGSIESTNSASLDTGSCNQRVGEDAGTPSKASIRKEVMKHVVRLSNPVWIKLSKQTLSQLKEKFPTVFQDVCLYSEVSHQMASATYRLSARRFLQELFVDLQFDALYEEPANILQVQANTLDTGIASPHSSSLPASPNVSTNNQDIIDRISLQAMQSLKLDNTFNLNVDDAMSQESEISHPRTCTFPVDIGPLPASLIQGTYSVKSPPLEVVKEESVSHSDTLSESNLMQSFASARNDVLVSATRNIEATADLKNSCITRTPVSQEGNEVKSCVPLVTYNSSDVKKDSVCDGDAHSSGLMKCKNTALKSGSVLQASCREDKPTRTSSIKQNLVLTESDNASSNTQGQRQRKLATTSPPNISSLKKSDTVPNSSKSASS